MCSRSEAAGSKDIDAEVSKAEVGAGECEADAEGSKESKEGVAESKNADGHSWVGTRNWFETAGPLLAVESSWPKEYQYASIQNPGPDRRV